MIKKLLLPVLLLITFCSPAKSQIDTLRLSSSFTTHIIFESDLSYVDLSDTHLVAAMIVEQSKNVLALKACKQFTSATSVTVIESNRQIHPFIVVYDPNPTELVVDFAKKHSPVRSVPGPSVNATPKATQNQPSIETIYSARQCLYHITNKQNDIRVSCENIVSFGDVLYLTLTLENESSTDYRIEGATFCIEQGKNMERAALQPRSVFSRNRYGNLSAAPGTKSREVYAFDKMTLGKKQVLRIYFYESDDQRNLILDIDQRDINSAQKGK